MMTARCACGAYTLYGPHATSRCIPHSLPTAAAERTVCTAVSGVRCTPSTAAGYSSCAALVTAQVTSSRYWQARRHWDRSETVLSVTHCQWTVIYTQRVQCSDLTYDRWSSHENFWDLINIVNRLRSDTDDHNLMSNAYKDGNHPRLLRLRENLHGGAPPSTSTKRPTGLLNRSSSVEVSIGHI